MGDELVGLISQCERQKEYVRQREARNMQNDMSEQINELAGALNKCQAQLEAAKKDATNPFFKSKYADLASVWEAIRKPLTDNGLSVSQLTLGNEGQVGVRTILMHTSGQWIQGTIWMKPTKPDPQGCGSTLTYARRYSLSGILGVIQDDDDGNAASKQQPKKEKKDPLRARKEALYKHLVGKGKKFENLMQANEWSQLYTDADIPDLDLDQVKELEERIAMESE